MIIFLICILTACNFAYAEYFGTIIHLRKISDAYALTYVWGHVLEQVLTPAFYLQLALSIALLITMWRLAPGINLRTPATFKKTLFILLPAIALHLATYYVQTARTDMSVNKARFLVGNDTAYFLYGFTPVYSSMLIDLLPHHKSGNESVGPIDLTLNRELEKTDMPRLAPDALFIIQAESLDGSALTETSPRGSLLMPFLNGLLKESVVLENYYVHHNGAASASAEIATLLSIIPSKEFNGLVTIDPPNIHALNHALKREGFVSMFLHSNKGSFFGRTDAYKKMAFDFIFDMPYFTGAAAGFLSKDIMFFEQAVSLIGENTPPGKKPFAYLVTMQSHGPFKNYDPSTRATLLQEGFGTEDNASLLLDYLCSMRELDEALAGFWNLIEQAPYERPLIILQPDHQSGVLDKAPDRVESGIALLWSPELPPQRIPVPTSSYDLAPTIMHLLHKDEQWEEAHWWIGNTVFTTGNRKAVLVNNIVLEGDGSGITKRGAEEAEQELIRFSLEIQD